MLRKSLYCFSFEAIFAFTEDQPTGWDGRDLPTSSHRFGLNMSSPSHDIYGMGDRPLSNGGYVRQTTGAAGHSVFIRIHPAFVKKGSPNY